VPEKGLRQRGGSSEPGLYGEPGVRPRVILLLAGKNLACAAKKWLVKNNGCGELAGEGPALGGEGKGDV